MGLHSNKNFVTTNAIQAILSKPKQMPEDFRFVLACYFVHQLCIHERCASCQDSDHNVAQPIITKLISSSMLNSLMLESVNSSASPCASPM